MNATAVKPLTVLEQLRNVRCDQQIQQRHLAGMIGVAPNSVGHWERGISAPNIRHVIAYARVVGRRLVVARNNQVVADLATVLPRLADLRGRQRLTRCDVAERLNADYGYVSAIERQTRTGVGVRLSTLERYLAALGYQINVAPLPEGAS
ncbi:helix-turn-helix transcriptional regulator [Nonomuraea sp. SYSU D8015]|uniref:helix-turn-helix transcriptional regulator n=1 Tax=Nonomuraea sp. SYSU D8015 TaxID=2593644 RepID=UPI00166070D0|nr:helix-turn-helix transcriptional regulator [Nonomuraea sp. SYSU D8015]